MNLLIKYIIQMQNDNSMCTIGRNINPGNEISVSVKTPGTSIYIELEFFCVMCQKIQAPVGGLVVCTFGLHIHAARDQKAAVR